MLNQQDYCKIFHEIKNSITVIGSTLQLIEKKHPDISQLDYWNTSMQEITYLRKLVTELSQNKIGDCIHLEMMDLRPLLEELTDSVRCFAETSDFHCILNMPSSPPPVAVDACKFKQALFNLLKNSYESMDRTGTALLNVFLVDRELHIDVTDFGCGVPEQYASTLFDSFVTSKINGTGLGLAITTEIVKAHNGTLSYHNNLEKGCTFSIVLPIQR